MREYCEYCDKLVHIVDIWGKEEDFDHGWYCSHCGMPVGAEWEDLRPSHPDNIPGWLNRLKGEG